MTMRTNDEARRARQAKQLAELLDGLKLAQRPRLPWLAVIGRRGVSLLFVALVGVVLSLGLIAPSAAQSAALGQIVPLQVWAGAWLVTAAVCVVQAFHRLDRLAFALAVAMFTTWSAQYFVAWFSGAVERGWLAAVIYLGFAGWMAVIATWPEAVRLPFSPVQDGDYPDAVITSNTSGMVTGWLGAAERIFGWKAEEIIGLPVVLLMPSRYRGNHNAAVARATATGVLKHHGQLLLAEALHRDGHEFTVQLFISQRLTDTGLIFITVVRCPYEGPPR